MSLRLIANDGSVLYISQQAIRVSSTLQNMIDNTQSDLENSQPVYIDYRRNVLQEVIGWCESQCRHRPIFERKRLDNEFLWRNRRIIFDLISVSDFLEIPCLLSESTTAVIKWIEGKSTHEIRAILGIEDDLTEDERRDAEHEWKLSHLFLFS